MDDKALPAALIVAFARPAGVIKLLKSCERAGVPRVYLAIDGATTQAIEERQNELLRTATAFTDGSTIELRVWRRPANLGTAVGVVTAIDWFFSHENSGYIFEDDLHVHPDFFIFAAVELELLVEDDDVWLISGNQFYPPKEETHTPQWTHYPLIWGWASWAAKWTQLRKAVLESAVGAPGILSRRIENYWLTGQRRSQLGLTDVWDVPLAANMRMLGKYTRLPPVNLIANEGFDDQASHTTNSAWPMNLPIHPLSSYRTTTESIRSADALLSDVFLEERLYQIKWRHSFSLLLSRLLDGRRNFPRARASSLKKRIAEVRIPGPYGE